jgi:excinuclease ABC subunit A
MAAVDWELDVEDAIVIHGAREHNLKNLSLVIPRNQLVVVSGVSGSGKSTLAFDLLFAEGQRRFLDSMNAYARQYVDQLPRPEVDQIMGLPPTVSIEQRTTRGGGKSTVATVTEIFHFVRLLFARLGTPHCPDCQLPVGGQTQDALVSHLKQETKQRGDLLLLAPVVRNRKGFHTEIAEWAAQQGYDEVRADGKIYSTHKPLRLDRFREHDVEVVIGVLERLGWRKPAPAMRNRRLIENALQVGHGTLFALDNQRQQSVHSTERVCPGCARSFAEIDPKMLSFNSARGWCPHCRGFGELFYLPEVDRGARAEDIEESWFDWQEGEREVCPECGGTRLNPFARAVRLVLQNTQGRRKHKGELSNGVSLAELANWSVAQAWEWFRPSLFAEERAAIIARDILPEIRERLRFLMNVGLGYLQLGRGVTTLSGGESQRIRLAAQLGSNLSGVLYVLDEPTIGLHARDNERLLVTLRALQAQGNSLVVVEHDEATLRQADYLVDLGPGAGAEGGRVVAVGTPSEIAGNPDSITGQCLSRRPEFPSRGFRRPVSLPSDVQAGEPTNDPSWLVLRHARKNNLRDLTVRFPLRRLVLITGVSGSGKSTLVRECLLSAVKASLNGGAKPTPPIELDGAQRLREVYEVDQSPIGRTPRSTPATYVGFFDGIRKLYAQTPEARLRGYGPGRFSFNSAAGRCAACDGAGQIKLTMSFLPPAYVKCETCCGTRFNQETLDIEYQGRTIAQVLDMSVAEARDFFANHRAIHHALQALHDVGLHYLKLGQTSPTLSGGEAQRVKLVTHWLGGLRSAAMRSDVRSPGRAPKAGDVGNGPAAPGTLFLLEEPTIGLHSSDVTQLLAVLHRLVDAGHSVIIIEHHLELIAEADWIIDLGPEAGGEGGRIVAEGTPEMVAKNKASHTGAFLRKLPLKS